MKINMAIKMIFMAFLAMNMVRTSLCKDFVVTDYGAKPDGKTESSKVNFL